MSQSDNMIQRTCLVEIYDTCGVYALSDPGLFLVSGECISPLPPQIKKRSKASGNFTSTLLTARGSVGVFTYDLVHHQHKDYNAVLAVMFSVPFDYNLYSNWCGAGIFNRGTDCDNDLFDLMYYGSEMGFVRVKGGAAARTFKGEIVEVAVNITDSSRAVLSVEVKELGRF
ncbi:unnamed protein product [Arctogadus glacialis]